MSGYNAVHGVRHLIVTYEKIANHSAHGLLYSGICTTRG